MIFTGILSLQNSFWGFADPSLSAKSFLEKAKRFNTLIQAQDSMLQLCSDHFQYAVM